MVAALIGLSGCRVDTNVSIVDRGGGQGTVTVAAVLDHEALDALGGETGLARQLSLSDLTSAGWDVSGPTPTASGGASIRVSHGFSSPSGAARLVSELAGSGPAASRPFRLSVTTHRGFLHVRDTLSGKVDLTCGLSCFGDPGLQAALGNPNGVATTPLLQQSHARPDQLFGFTLTAKMDGKLRSENADTRNRSELTWTTPLGQVTEISASSETLNTANIVVVAVVGGLVIAGAITALAVRRRRHRGKHTRGWRIWRLGRKGAPAD